MKNHVSLDLETLGVRFSSAILSIGGVQFDPATGEQGQTFYKEIDLASAIKAGTISADTLSWWMTHPNAKARDVFKKDDGKVGLATALDELASWIRAMDTPRVWGNGACFDISILEHAYLKGAVGLSAPWHFTNIRDMRTIVEVADYYNWPAAQQIADVGTSHNALDDATFQARVISACWRRLRTGKAETAKRTTAPAQTYATDDEI